jgi:hypothetical protein
MLDFTEALKLKNFKLRYSIDPTTEHYPKQKMSKAMVASKRPKGFVTCPASLRKGHVLKCVRDCSLCLDTSLAIHFPPHGKNKFLFAKYDTID